MAELLTLVGPIASGKSTVADLLAQRYSDRGNTAVVVDVDDVAVMVRGAGAAATGLWPAAHRAHGALVAGWLATEVDLVVAVGPIYDAEEQRALGDALPRSVTPLRVLLDAPVETTWARAKDDPARGLSRDHDFHHRAHARFRELLPAIPADLVLAADALDATEIADAILAALADR